MEVKEKLIVLEEIMEIDKGTLSPEIVLANLKEWNSMAALTFIMMLDEEFGKNITADEIMKFITIEDMLKVME